MANYYLQYAFDVPLDEVDLAFAKALQVAVNELRDLGEEDFDLDKVDPVLKEPLEHLMKFGIAEEPNELSFATLREPAASQLHFSHEDSDDLDGDALFVHALLRHTGSDHKCFIGGAMVCDKPRSDAFSGLTLIVDKDGVECVDSTNIAMNRAKAEQELPGNDEAIVDAIHAAFEDAEWPSDPLRTVLELAVSNMDPEQKKRLLDEPILEQINVRDFFGAPESAGPSA